MKNLEHEIEKIKVHPHIHKIIVDNWGTVKLKTYLEHLLQDTRNGSRQGFSLSISSALLSVALYNLTDLEQQGLGFDTPVDEGFGNTKWDLPTNF